MPYWSQWLLRACEPTRGLCTEFETHRGTLEASLSPLLEKCLCLEGRSQKGPRWDQKNTLCLQGVEKVWPSVLLRPLTRVDVPVSSCSCQLNARTCDFFFTISRQNVLKRTIKWPSRKVIKANTASEYHLYWRFYKTGIKLHRKSVTNHLLKELTQKMIENGKLFLWKIQFINPKKDQEVQ